MHHDTLHEGYFDSTLEKYKPLTHLTVVESIKPKHALDLAQLWQKYSEYKKTQVSPSTYATAMETHREGSYYT